MDGAASKGGWRLQESKPGIFSDGPTRGPGNPRGPLGPAAPTPTSPWKAENSRGATTQFLIGFAGIEIPG